jgi:hypothetical protein
MRTPRIFYWKYTFNYNGFIIPYVGIVLNSSVRGVRGEDVLIEHEKVHYKQFEKYGAILFILLYLMDVMYHSYDLSLFEIEARFAEDNFAKYNYTYAVRNGLAKTPHNPNFRKGKSIYKLKSYQDEFRKLEQNSR